MASGLIDFVATVVLLLILIFVGLLASIRTSEAIASTIILGLTVVCFVGFPAAMETATRGRTLGKLAVGLRTVRDDGGPITAQHALVRALVGYVEIYLSQGAIAFFTIVLSSRGKRLGDYAAGTYVVRERVALSLPHPPAMPDHLRSWAYHADIAAIPSGLSLAVRQFLGRSGTFETGSRATIAAKLAARVESCVSPPPPPGTSHEDYLRAVLSSRRERDTSRLDKAEQLRRRLTSQHR